MSFFLMFAMMTIKSNAQRIELRKKQWKNEFKQIFSFAFYTFNIVWVTGRQSQRATKITRIFARTSVDLSA